MTKTEEEKQISLKNIQKKLVLFFPEEAYSFTQQAVEDGMASGEFMTKAVEILPFTQTAFLDDKILEVELDGLTRIYFSRINDDLPDLEKIEDENGELTLIEPAYTTGEYLKLMNHLIILPIEPGMGNLHLRNSQKIVLRFFTSTSAIELGTFFQDIVLVRDLPVLRLAFPFIGRQVQGVRAFRAKVTKDMNFSLFVKGKKKRPDINTEPIDISTDGLSFEIKKEQQKMFKEDEICTIHFIIDGNVQLRIKGTVRHISKVRKKKSIQYRCGLQLDITTRAIAADVETIVATVQRFHLKELSEMSEESGIDLVR